MVPQGSSVLPEEHRDNLRWSVNSFLQVTAKIWEHKPAEGDDEPGQCWSGMLVNISCEGAQVILPEACQKHIHVNQIVAMRICVKLEDINVDLSGQVKFIIPGQCYDTVRVGVEFTDLQNNQKGNAAVRRMCELAEKFQIPAII